MVAGWGGAPSDALVSSDTTQASASAPQWSAATYYSYQWLSEGRPSWQRWNGLLQRRTEAGAWVVGVTRQQRFRTPDVSFRTDAWHDLWTNAYGHLYLAYGPSAHTLPRRAVRAELYQGMHAWEVVGRYEWRSYTGDAVHVMGVGLGMYAGAWYLRTRTVLVPRGDVWAIAQSAHARRYVGSSDSYVDAQVGMGRGVEVVGPGPSLQLTRTYFGAVRLQYYLTNRWGFSVGASYSGDDFFTRRGVSGGLLVRW